MLVRDDALMEVHINCGNGLNNNDLVGVEVLILYKTNGRVQGRRFGPKYGASDAFQSALSEACITYGIILRPLHITVLRNHYNNNCGYTMPNWYQPIKAESLDISFDDLVNDWENDLSKRVNEFNNRFAR